MPAAPPFEAELSRRSFVKGGGALVVGLALGREADGAGRAAASPFASNGPADSAGRTRTSPIHADNTGIGQDRPRRARPGLDDRAAAARRRGARHGRRPARLRPARHERDAQHRRHLRVELDRASPGRGCAAPRAAARQALLALASQQLGVPVASLSVAGGVVSGGGRSVTYGELVGDRLLERAAGRRRSSTPAQAPAKPVASYALVGHRADRRASTSRRR